jgi:hypothetical protein
MLQVCRTFGLCDEYGEGMVMPKRRPNTFTVKLKIHLCK